VAEAAPRPLTVVEAFIPIVTGGLFLGASFLLFAADATKGPLQTAIICATAGAMLIGRRAGHDFRAMREAAFAGIVGGFGTMAVLFAVGALLGTWAMSGTLLALGYYLLPVLTPDLLYLTSAIIAALIGFAIASAWTTASTVGICLVGIALQIGVDPAITAGAVISGAYFGDKLSPRSKKSELAATAAGVELATHRREALWTSLPAFALTLSVFWWLGEPASRDAAVTAALLDAELRITPVLLLPLGLVIVLAIAGLPPFMTMLTGALAGGLVAIVMKTEFVLGFAALDGPVSLALLKGLWQAMATGYVSTTGVPGLDAFLSRGGMASMLDTIWLIAAALAFGGIVERLGLLHRLLEPVIQAIRSPAALVTTTVGAAFATNLVTADQQTGTGLVERILKPAYEAMGIHPVILSRAAADSASVTSPLIPWNSCGAYLAAALGISTLTYAPYVLFAFFSPALTILIAWTGLRGTRPVS
jgi:NhaC family Na+:H+ antiporter